MQAGLKLSGRYALQALLGSGGMGEVWRGVDEHLDRPVAVKVLRAHLADPELAGRFRREARIAARLQHPGIAVVHDVGSDNGQLFIVMELLHGRDLAAMLAEAPAGLPVDTVVPLAIQAAEALRAAHAGHVVHRDLKPANLFVVDGGLLKICDFGIAWAVDSTTHLTATGQAIGTPAYMSPEQCQGQQVDERSDLYSLGCVLYALLTGQPPFVEGQPLSIMLQHLNAAPAAPRTIRPDIPPELDHLVLELLAKNPACRPDEGRVIAALQALSYTPTLKVESTAQASTRLDLGSPRRPGSTAGSEPTVTPTDTPSVQPARITRVPRTEAERQQVLLDRDIGWEYLYFAGQLLYERDSAEAKYSDREVHYSPPSAEAVTADDIVRYVEYIDQQFDDAMSLAREVGVIINMNDEAALEQAFGAAFQPGDPERLAQLAKRWNGFYVRFLDWAVGLKEINAPSELRNLLEIIARFANEPLEKYRRFVDEYVAQVDEFPARIAVGEPLRIEGSISLSSPDEVAEAYVTELNRLRNRLQQPPGTYKSPPPLPYISGQELEPTCPVCGLLSALHTGAPCPSDR
jgi:serine/threonine protein kinase